MTDYLAEARAALGAAEGQRALGSPFVDEHLSLAQTYATLAVAEALAALTLPQGTEHVTGETTGAVTPSPSPAEPEPGWECPACRYQGPQALTESSLVLLDQTEEVMAAARHLRALWQPEAGRQSAAWWKDAGDLFRAVDGAW